ncbi:MAG TPA: phosphoribosylamine--glycine ligase, partial [Chthoniobacterales bacterium]|nr:phosphoribosylamine--glycine ligase [Chthoniobacterales bacterium]
HPLIEVMKILVIGGGGREHALTWKLHQSPMVERIYVAPGNAGTGQMAQNVPIPASEFAQLLQFALVEKIDLTVVGPDDALAGGIVDRFQAHGLRIFGPNQQAAKLESSKSFAKHFMLRHGIPTARFTRCESIQAAMKSLDHYSYPVVIKADGLALGKGVTIAHDRTEAEGAIDAMMQRKQFGAAGERIVIEEYLRGTECSIHALVDGSNYLLFPSAKDHKTLYANDQGPNTGGMGTISPSPRITAAQMKEIETKILQPFVRGIRTEELDFRGLLFPGLMLTEKGPVVLEFNCRFGDPEAQAFLPRLQVDLLELLEATIDQRLDVVSSCWNPRSTVCVVLASKGYPGHYEINKPIQGLDSVKALEEVTVFHAGTKVLNDMIVTAGGRVLSVVALGETLGQASDLAYRAAEKIEFDGKYFRPDIGSKYP